MVEDTGFKNNVLYHCYEKYDLNDGAHIILLGSSLAES